MVYFDITMLSLFFKRRVRYSLSLNNKSAILFTLGWCTLLLLGNTVSFEVVDCFVTLESGHSIARQPVLLSSLRSHKPHLFMNSRQEASKVKTLEKERTIVIIYNKPPNMITSHESQDSRATVYEDIQSMRGFLSASKPSDVDRNRKKSPFHEHKFMTPTTFAEVTGIRSKLHAIGRLDADTTGLLLLTNDGRLVHHVTNPVAKIQEHEFYRNSSDGAESTTNIITKTYEALIMGHHTEESLRQIRYGVDIGKNYTTSPLLAEDDLKVLEHPNHRSTIVSITICEGKNRQVRKMFHAIGSGVMKLKRTRIGKKLSLGGMREGEWRVLTDKEVQHCLNWKPREIAPPSSIRPRPRHNSRKDSSRKLKRKRWKK